MLVLILCQFDCNSAQSYGRFWHFTLNFFLNWQYTPIRKPYRGVPLFQYSITLKSSSIKYSICRKSSYARSNLKKNKKIKIKIKICIELEFQEIEFHAKIIYKCDRPIFKEPYSGVFKPYSDVLKPYSSVFLQIFLLV